MSSSLINRTIKKIQLGVSAPSFFVACRNFKAVHEQIAKVTLREILSDEVKPNSDENIREVSIEFCKRAFRLLADCGLITEANVQFLSSAEACKDYDPQLKFPYNRSEDVLREVEIDDDIHDAKSYKIFYRGDKMHVICGGTKYLIANIDRDKKIQAQGVNPRAFHCIHAKKRSIANKIASA